MGQQLTHLREADLEGLFHSLETEVQDPAELPAIAGRLKQELIRRIRAEVALRASEARLTVAMEAAQMGTWERNLKTGEDFWSEQEERLFGLAPGSFADAHAAFLKMVEPEDVPKLAEAERRALEENAQYRSEFRIRWPDGSVHWMAGVGNVIRDEQGQPLRMVGVTMDISERKRVEEELQAHQQRLELAQEAGRIGTFEFDYRSKRFQWSAETEALYGHPEGGIGKAAEEWAHRVHAEDIPVVETELYEAAMMGRYVRDFRVIWPDGSLHWVQARAKVFFDEKGKPLRMVGVNVDISAAKHAEKERMELLHREQVAHADAQAANRSKDRFFAALSHELRTPLTPVMTAAQLLEKDPGIVGGNRELVEMIRRNVALEARLIDDLLDLTRISRGKLELSFTATDIHETLRQVVEMCDADIRAKEIKVVMEAQAARPQVWSDSTRLQQILWNLIKNAAKFTPKGGSITVRTENTNDGFLTCTIQDTGIGISSKMLPRVFRAFEQGGQETTREYGGVGIGLAIANGLVDLHGGTLTAHSKGKGEGATFVLRLPIASMAQSNSQETTTKRNAPVTKRTGRILLVEDNQDTVAVMVRLLRSFGYSVRTAGTVADGLQVAEIERFDLLICDIGLPDGNGLALMRQLSARRPIKAIALSGYGTDEDVRQAHEAGFMTHLTKPVNMEKLEEVILGIVG